MISASSQFIDARKFKLCKDWFCHMIILIVPDVRKLQMWKKRADRRRRNSERKKGGTRGSMKPWRSHSGRVLVLCRIKRAVWLIESSLLSRSWLVHGIARVVRIIWEPAKIAGVTRITWIMNKHICDMMEKAVYKQCKSSM